MTDGAQVIGGIGGSSSAAATVTGFPVRRQPENRLTGRNLASSFDAGGSGRLRLARERRGLSQTALGKLADKSQQTISDWENGSLQPTFDALRDLTVALGESPEIPSGMYLVDLAAVEEIRRGARGKSPWAAKLPDHPFLATEKEFRALQRDLEQKAK